MQRARRSSKVPRDVDPATEGLDPSRACRQPRRDRGSRDADVPRARARDRRGVQRRRPARAARPGRRLRGRDRPGAGRRRATSSSTRSSTRAGRAAPTRSTPATAFFRRTRISQTPAPPRASRSSARRPRRCARWGARPRRARPCRAAGTPVVPGDNGPAGNGFPDAQSGARGGREDRVPRPDQGGGRRRRQGHAPGRRRGRVRRRVRRRAPRSDGRVRRRHRLPREGDHPAAPHRDPGVRRHPRQPRPPRRARLLDPAPPPEGDRGSAVAGDHRRGPREDGRGRGRRRARGQLRRRRHVRVPARSSERRLLLPRDEHAAPGRAPGDRDDLRRSIS